MMCNKPTTQKVKMSQDRLSYLLNMLVKYYRISMDMAYAWLRNSKTYTLIVDLNGLFYYAPELGLWDLTQCEYEGRWEDWKWKVASY